MARVSPSGSQPPKTLKLDLASQKNLRLPERCLFDAEEQISRLTYRGAQARLKAL